MRLENFVKYDSYAHTNLSLYVTKNIIYILTLHLYQYHLYFEVMNVWEKSTMQTSETRSVQVKIAWSLQARAKGGGGRGQSLRAHKLRRRQMFAANHFYCMYYIHTYRNFLFLMKVHKFSFLSYCSILYTTRQNKFLAKGFFYFISCFRYLSFCLPYWVEKSGGAKLKQCPGSSFRFARGWIFK